MAGDAQQLGQVHVEKAQKGLLRTFVGPSLRNPFHFPNCRLTGR